MLAPLFLGLMKTILSALLIFLLLPLAHAQLVVAPISAQCATSVDGSVVGTPNPLNPPVVAAQYSGSLPAGNYYVQIAWYDASAHVTLPGPEVAVQLSGSGQIQVSPPTSGMPSTAVGTQVFIGATSGSETLQGSVAGSATYSQSVPLVAGSSPPSSNNTVCQIVANDSGWPTGTGYNVSITTPAGSVLPGYPMQWQLLGPGNTINLGQGLPLYNGVVTYPVPILAVPYGHAPQSISGPLSLGNYNLTAGKVGTQTASPAWGFDAEGSGTGSMVNANGGFLVNGLAPTAGTCLGSTDGVANDTQIPVVAGFVTGQLVQGGTIQTTGGNFSVNFPAAFSTIGVSCVASALGGPTSLTSCTKTGMSGTAGGGITTVYWMALGKQ